MRKTPIVVAIITLACGLVAAGTALAQDRFDVGGRALPRGELRVPSERQNQPGAHQTQGAGMIVTSDTPAAWEAVRQYRATGRPAMLGITIYDRDQGVAVVRVSPGGPADESGVETDDLIVAVDGVGLTDGHSSRSPTDALIAQMGAVELGDTVTLTLRRGGDEQEIEIETRTLGSASYFVL